MIRADVGGRALATDMLLASCERQAECAAAVAVASLADQPPGHLPKMRHSRRHESESRSAKLQWHAEALPLTDGDIDSEVARRAKQAECDAFRGSRDSNCAGAMRNLRDCAQRFDDSACIGISRHSAEG